MKVLMLYHHLDLPEAHITVGLKAEGLDLRVLCHPESPNLDILKDAGIEPVLFPFNSKVSISGVKRVKALVNDFKPDIVHAFSGKAISNSVMCSYLIPFPKLIAYRGTFGDISKLDPASWLTFLNPRVDKIVCVAKFIEQGFLSIGVPPEKVCTIYKGHDPDWYQPKSPKTKAELGIPEDAFVIGCVANMRKTKGIDILIKAAESLSDRIKNLRLLLIGEIQDAEIQQQIEQSRLNDKILAVGSKPLPADYLPLIDVLAMPSRRDGLAKSVIEAMSAEKVCVVSSVGGLAELIRDDIDGQVVLPCDSNALADAIEKAFKQDLSYLARSAKQRIKDSFNIESSITQLQSLYQNY